MAVEGVPPFAQYVPGADAAQNEQRRITVRAGIIHTTEGTDSRGLGANRHHNSPGTFNFLIRQGVLYCYYPAWVRCSHAAGGNYSGPGIEIDMYDGTPVREDDLRILGRLLLWLYTTYGIPLNYKAGDPREWIDQTGYLGFIAHAGIDYPPDTSLRHYDNITPSEFARALAFVGGDLQERDMQPILVHTTEAPFTVYRTDGTRQGTEGPLTSQRLAWLRDPYVGAVLLANTDLHKINPTVLAELTATDSRVLDALKSLFAWLLKAVPATWRTRGGTPPSV